VRRHGKGNAAVRKSKAKEDMHQSCKQALGKV